MKRYLSPSHFEKAFTPQRQAGFTLVEMAVVLVIIGIILGAVMIGRDAQRNAEYTRIRQNFVSQWAMAYNSYTQRFGVPPGDEARAPKLMVNGANYHGPLGGNLSTVTEPPAICTGEAGPNMGRAAESRQGFSLRELMLRAGVQLPQGRGQGMEDRYAYLDSNGNPQEVKICFQWNRPGTFSGSGNVMVLTGLTPDLARALSSAIDGNTDASSGSFRQAGIAQGAGSEMGLDWAANNTQVYGSEGTATETAEGTAEAQVITVVAHYKMNQ